MPVFPHHSNPIPGTPLTAEGASNNSVAVDLSVLNSFDEVQTDGEPDFVVELIDLYQKETAILLERISQSVDQNDWLSVKRAAHSLRGSSGNLGIIGMSRTAEQLELQELDGVIAKELAINLDREFVRVLETLLRERERRTR